MRIERQLLLGGLAAAFVTALMPDPAAAAEAYPARPIEVVVPFGPGGGADVMGRQFAKQAEAKLGVAMPVTNLAGASGDVGLARVAASPPDGHTIGQVIALTVTAWAAGVGAPRLDGLEYVALMQNSPSMLFVSKNSPLKSFADFAAEAKARPGSIDVATSGVGTPDDITLRYLAANGITTVAIPFGKPGERYASTVGGHTDAIYEEPGDVVGFLQSGDLRPLVVFDTKRHPAFPDVPTSGEFGLDISDLPNFRAIAVPAGTPPERVGRLRAVAGEILASPEWQAFCAGTYTCTDPLAPAAVKELVATTYERARGYFERFKTAVN
ncbi:MAG TPA: tripartite tricarboxylate transporter substrate binding protein [Geminicoccaceae bacterium]